MVIDRQKKTETCLVIVTGLVAIFMFKEWIPLLIAAVIVGFIGVFLNKPAEWLTWIWFKIAEILGKIIPKVLLIIIYYFLLFPLALLSRIAKGSQLSIQSKKDYSQWIEREHTYIKNDLIKPW